MTVPVYREPTTDDKIKALLEGYRGPRVWDYQLWRSNRNGELLERLETVASGELNVSNAREHTYELGLNLREDQNVDLWGDTLKLIVRLYDGLDRTWHAWPMGLYSVREPKGVDAPAFTMWDLTGYSLEQLLLDDMATGGYKAPAGSGCLALVKSILTNRYGIDPTRIKFPAADVVLGGSIFFTPWQDAESARYLNICNTILAAGGFYALHTDGEGNFRTSEVEGMADSEAAVEYGTAGDSERLIIGEISWEYSAENFGNVFTIYAGDANVSPPVVGTAELHQTKVTAPNAWTTIVVDPVSEFSIEALGYRKQAEPEMLENIVSTAVAKNLAARRLKLAASNEQRLQFNTVFDPRRGPREVYALDVRREDGTRLHNYKVRADSWSASLNFEGGGMRHEVSRLIGG